jgi:uncharacterized protein YkwD
VNRAILAICVTIVFGASAVAGYGIGHLSRSLHPVTHVKGDVNADESCIAAAINSDRAAAGLPALPVDGGLSAYSRSHSSAMAAAGTIFHSGGSPSNQIPADSAFRAALPLPWRDAAVAGENVGDDSADDCAGMNAAFMASPPHKANILDARWTTMGVGVAFSAAGGLYVTEDFADIPPAPSPRPSPSPAPAPSPAASPRAVGCGA